MLAVVSCPANAKVAAVSRWMPPSVPVVYTGVFITAEYYL